MLLPVITEQTQKSMLFYFEIGANDPAALRAEIEAAYPCLAAIGETVKDGKRCICIEIDGVDDAL